MDKKKAVRKAVGQEGAFVEMLNQEIKELQDSMKQKQIEEMAAISYGIFTADNHCPFDKNCPYLGGKVRFGCNDCLRAVAIINAGYRKIPEGSVVLTKEEYEKLCDLAYFGNGEEVIRKETAEKIYKMADEIATGSQNDGVNIMCAIAKEFGLYM